MCSRKSGEPIKSFALCIKKEKIFGRMLFSGLCASFGSWELLHSHTINLNEASSFFRFTTLTSLYRAQSIIVTLHHLHCCAMNVAEI